MKRILSLVAILITTLLLSLIPQLGLQAQTTRGSDDGSADASFQQARDLYISNHFMDALVPLNRAIQQKPDFADAYALRAEIYMNLSGARYADAWADIQHVFELDADHWFGYIARANYYAYQDQFSNALEDANQAITMRPNSADGYYMLGDVYLIQGDYQNALDSFDKALLHEFEIFDTIWAYNDRGNAHSGLEDYAAALDDFNHAVSLHPADKAELSDVLYLRALAQYQLGNEKDALDDLKESIDTTPADHWSLHQAYNLRGVIYDSQGNNKSAISSYDLAIQTAASQEVAEEDYAIYFRNRAFSYVNSGDCATGALDALTYTTMLESLTEQDKSDIMSLVNACKK